MDNEKLTALRRNVAGHDKAARARPLLELAAGLADRYWRIGPGRQDGTPYLDEAIASLDEAYDLFEPGEFMRGQAAALLGWLLGIRHSVHGGGERDRETGIRMLEEALTFPQLPPMIQGTARLILGQLLLARMTGRLQGPDAPMRLMGGLSPEETADADRAADLFRQVADGPAVSPQLTALAQILQEMAQTLQMMSGGFSGGPGGMDFGRLMQTVAAMQKLQQQAAAGGSGFGLAPGMLPNLFEASTLAEADPLDRPVAVVDALPPKTPVAPRPQPERPRPAAAPSADALRAQLLAGLPGSGFEALFCLLDEAAPAPAVDTIDERVALAGALVEASGSVGTDQLLLAVALYLRSLVDDGGWDDVGPGGEVEDVRAAADRLLAAGDALLAAPAEAVALAVRLGTLLDRRHPAGQVSDRLTERFRPVTEALRTVGANALLLGSPGRPLLLSAETGRFRCSTSGSGPSQRLLVAGEGPVPDDAVVSQIRSAAQVVALAARAQRPVAEAPVFLSNPRGDRKPATLDALQLRRAYYPLSVGLGETGESATGPGTPDEVLSRLDASMLHLGCGITEDGGLELAGSAVLDAAEIAAGPPAATGGLAVLPATLTGASALTAALLTARFVGVVGFREPVPDDISSVIYLQLHAELVDAGRSPAAAVAAVRRWLADPHRTPPEQLPPWLAAIAADPAPADPAVLVHYGV